MKIKLFFKIFLVLLVFIPKVSYAIDPPVIIATGNQIYCPGTPKEIVETITITNDPAEPTTDAIYIQISSGYVNGQDILTLNGTHPTITSSWDINTGKLKLFSPTGIQVSYLDFEAAIKEVQFNNFSASATGTRSFSISIGQANYLPSTGHYYQFIPNIGITWTDAKIAAETSTYYGIKGYLVTIAALDESQLAGTQALGNGWIGGSDAANEGEWKWVTGPENGTVFWNGATNGSTPNFAFWNTGEPNNLGNENYAHITAPGVGIPGSWNDLPDAGGTGNYNSQGYIVEYGGTPGDPVLQISTSTKMTIAQITSTTPDSVCGSGNLTLKATSTTGTVNWYDALVAGNLLFTGNTYTTPFISTTTPYYVQATDCITTRIPVIATITIIPTITSTNTPVSICGPGSVTLEATTNIGTVNWYSQPTGGIVLATGTSFTIPNATTSTKYYVEATNNGCSNGIRILVDVLVYTPPIVSDQEVTLCKSSTVTLDASIPNLTYLWSNGETSQKIVVSTAGIYTVDVTSLAPENCTSRKTITVVGHNIPEINRVDVNETTIVIYLKKEESYFEYSVDGINYQSSNVFFNVPSGLLTAYVREINFCSSDTAPFIVLIVPKFFTPNNDGFNDLWQVKGIINYPEAQVSIFDKYGKLLKQLNATSSGWNGMFNGAELPADDYWYFFKIDKTSTQKSGHFSLKR